MNQLKEHKDFIFRAEDLKCSRGREGDLNNSTARRGTRVCLDSSNQLVVVKYRQMKKEERNKKNFYEDISTLSRVCQVNLSSVYGTLLHSNYIGMIMEFHWLGNLKTAMLNSDRNIAPLLQLKICHDVSCGLSFISKQFKEIGFHGNFKPENVLITENMLVKITGFLESKLELTKNLNPNQITRINICYDAFYQPPEVYCGGEVDNEKLDVYSLGMVMHMVLTRHLPCPPNEIYEQWERTKTGERPNMYKIENLKQKLHQSNRYDDKFTIQYLEDVMKGCWEQDAYSRPSIADVYSQLKNHLDKYPFSVLQLHLADARTRGKKFKFDPAHLIDFVEVLQKQVIPTCPSSPPPVAPRSKPKARPRVKSKSEEENPFPTPPPRPNKMKHSRSHPILNRETPGTIYEEINYSRKSYENVQRYVTGPFGTLLPDDGALPGRSIRSNTMVPRYKQDGTRRSLPEVPTKSFFDYNARKRVVTDSNISYDLEEEQIKDEIILLESVNEIRKQFESGQTRAATEKFKTLVETNNINLSIILSENTFYDIIKTLSIFQNDKLVSTKCKLLNILFRLTQNTVNSTQKLSQIVACARTALEMARCLQKNLLALSSIDETIFPFLKKCCEKADLLSLADEENEFAMKAWCKVYFCSCCNIIDKYSTAEEIAEQTILNLKLKFRDIASKYSVLAALYHVRATARKLAGQYDKAIKDYKHEIQSLTDVEDISGLERKQRLDIACEQLDATQKFIRN